MVGSVALSGIGLRILPRGELTRDPVTLAIIPGTALAGATLLIWALVAGGRRRLAMVKPLTLTLGDCAGARRGPSVAGKAL